MGDTSKSNGYIIAMDEVRKTQKASFVLKCNEINGDTIDISEFEYTGSRGRGKCKCKICGHEWEDIPEILYKRKMCPECQKRKKKEEKRFQRLNEYKLKAESIYEQHAISDINFYYNDKGGLMVSFYCHETYCDGTEHGLQEQTGFYFLKGHGCAKCATQLSKPYTTEEWVRNAKYKYPEFSYEKTCYVNKQTKLIVTCLKHGDFLANPKDFMSGRLYCPKCTEERMHNKFVNSVIERAKEVHKNDEYIYHPELITKSTEKMGIECKKHGIFWQSISNHIQLGTRCPLCVREEYVSPKKLSFSEVIDKAHKIHGDKYEYSENTYVNTMTKMLITCPIHGEFWQTMHSHLTGQGCPKCGSIMGGLKIRLTQDEFIERAKKIHKNENFDYSRAVYDSCSAEVEIGCPKHGFFKVNTTRFLNGQGCPICRLPKLEKDVRNLLIENSINFEQQKRFPEWLGRQSLDFYLPDYKIAIECQGIQHFKNERGYQDLENIKKRDETKKRLCKEYGLKLVYYVPEIFSEYMDKNDIYFVNTDRLYEYIQKQNVFCQKEK